MAKKRRRRRFKRVLVDVDVQYDLVYRNNRDQSSMLRNIRRLFAWCRQENIPVISTALARRPRSFIEPSNHYEQLCIEGTAGQKKIRYTMLNSNILFGPENRLDLPRNILREYQQVIFEKRIEDPFSLPRADRLLCEIKTDEFIVCGMGLDEGLKYMVLGLLCRQKKVLVVQDAIENSTPYQHELMLRKFEAKGAVRIKTSALAGRSRLVGPVGRTQPWESSLLINARIG